GQMMHKGDKILRAQDKQLEAQLASFQAQLRSLEAQRQQFAVLDQGQLKIVEATIPKVRQQLTDTQRRIDELTLTAPIDGVLVAPKLTEMSGAFLPRGQEIASVAAMDTLVIKAALTQEDAQLIHDHTDVLMSADSADGKSPIQVQFAGDIKLRDSVPAA